LAKVAALYDLAPLPRIAHRTDATDGTVKFLLELADGKRIETVHIPEETRGTLCISTQVGCAMNCRFCFTAAMGLERHLAPHEMIGQWHVLRRELAGRPVSNVVFMGMGEPLHNVENLLVTLDILNGDYAIGLPARRTTVSTSGMLPGIERLTAHSSARIALSVNGSTAAKRRKVMPIQRAYPIEDVLNFFRGRDKGNHHEVMFEYVMLAGENDSEDDARDLLVLLEGVPGRINLIPYNPHPASPYGRPDRTTVLRFHTLLRAAGRNVFVRHSRGSEVLAACGQLHAEMKAQAG
jgi:23S rRNA (adenine2503-C2)-methyltransferase